MNIYKEIGKDRKGIDWINQYRKGYIKGKFKSNNSESCIFIRVSGKRCRNRRIKDRLYCSEHLPENNHPEEDKLRVEILEKKIIEDRKEAIKQLKSSGVHKGSRLSALKKSLPKKNGRNCIAIDSKFKRCRNRRVEGEMYCEDHVPKID